MRIIFEETGNKLRIGLVLNDIANTYHQQGQDSLALSFAMESLKICRQIQVKDQEMKALITIGSIYTYQDDLQQAEEVLMKGLSIAEEMGDTGSLCHTLNGLTQLAHRKKEWQKVKKYSQRSLEKAKELESIKLIRTASRFLWESQEALG